MTESKITATDRLRKEGRWEEASLWRDEKRKQLRTNGQTKADSNEESWDAMLKQFPPLSPSDHAPDAGNSTDGLELVDVGSGDYDDHPNLSRDVLWVYENLARSDMHAEDAPSLGAWSLLDWARKHRDQFYEKMLPKAMAAKEKQSNEQQTVEDPGIEDLDKMIEAAVVAWEHEAVADMDATIKKTVKAYMEDWERKYRLDLAPDARESWGLQMIRIGDAIEAMTKHQAASKAG